MNEKMLSSNQSKMGNHGIERSHGGFWDQLCLGVQLASSHGELPRALWYNLQNLYSFKQKTVVWEAYRNWNGEGHRGNGA